MYTATFSDTTLIILGIGLANSLSYFEIGLKSKLAFLGCSQRVSNWIRYDRATY